MKKIALLFTASLFLLHGSYAQTITSSVPGYISYQGRALDATGAVIGSSAPVNRTVTFRIWDHPSNVLDANLLYSEQQVVTISGGEFSVLIGQGVATTGAAFNYSEAAKGVPTVKISDLSVFGGATRYLGVTIDDGTSAVDNEITPRQQIVSSAYAFRAKYAEQLGTNGYASITAVDSGNVGIGNTSPFAPLTITRVNTSTTSSFGQLTLTTDDATEQLRMGVSSTDNSSFFQAYKQGVGSQNLLLNPMGGNVGIGTTNPTAALSVTGSIAATGGISGGSFTTTGSFTTSSGKVGIGISSPVSRLDIVDGADAGTYGSVKITRPATGHTGSHLSFVREGVAAIGLGYGQSSNTFGFGQGTVGAFTPGYLAIDTNNGKLGIGVTTPNTYLTVQRGSQVTTATTSGAVADFGAADVHTYFGSYDGASAYATWLQAMRAADQMTFPMAINPNGGNVGIGTPNPQYKLDVNGGARTTGPLIVGGQINLSGHILMNNNQTIYGQNTSGGNEPAFWPRAGDGTYLNYGAAGFYIRNNSSTTTMFMQNDGKVKIGTGRADAILNVGAVAANVSWNGYLDTNGGSSSNGSGVWPLSIACDGVLLGSRYFVISDRRIKTKLSTTDSAKDLKTLMGIEVTDYELKDTVANGIGRQKKVIAQQVETVYPQAVSRQKGVLPDIYQKAGVKDGWVMLATDLKVGERVRLLGSEGSSIEDVLEVRGDSFRSSLKTTSEQVFVYGREVSDFRTVDYDALSMLNVSATQELARQLKTAQDENAKLRRELAAKDKRLEARLIALEQRLSQTGVAETVSIKTANAAN